MTNEDFKLVESWIEAAGKHAHESDFQEVYKHGWYGGVTRVQILMDDYRKSLRDGQERKSDDVR